MNELGEGKLLSSYNEVELAYANDEMVLIKNLLSTNEVDDLRLGVDKNISNPSSCSKITSDGNDPGWFPEDFCT